MFFYFKILYSIPRNRISINIAETRSTSAKIKAIAIKSKPLLFKIYLIIVKLTTPKNLYYNIKNNWRFYYYFKCEAKLTVIFNFNKIYLNIEY